MHLQNSQLHSFYPQFVLTPAALPNHLDLSGQTSLSPAATSASATKPGPSPRRPLNPNHGRTPPLLGRNTLSPLSFSLLSSLSSTKPQAAPRHRTLAPRLPNHSSMQDASRCSSTRARQARSTSSASRRTGCRRSSRPPCAASQTPSTRPPPPCAPTLQRGL